MNTLKLSNGTEITTTQLKSALEAGQVVLLHSRNKATQVTIDARMFDTRGQCSRIIDEQWTTKPKNAQEVLLAVLN